ncbi:WSC-domain-containing protein [Ramaria rubella]|nr:WSC-domain-containing protein [Ramaria rubella]
MRLLTSLYTLSALVVAVTCSLPDSWIPIGCWSDKPSMRTLEGGAYYVDPRYNNQETCVAFCDFRGYTYAGVEYGRVAYCGDEIQNGATEQLATDCTMPCAFNASHEECGGPNRLTLFKSTYNTPYA